jgi:spore maturation protein CgeB
MKVLISGYHNPHFITITEYIERAIRSLGHELYVFDDRQHIIPGRIRERIPWLTELDLHHINRQFKSLVLNKKPDIVIVTGGHRIMQNTVKALKKKNIETILWTIDAPIDFEPIVDAARHYDHIFCQGTEAIKLLEMAGIKGARWLPMACDPDIHHAVKMTDEERVEVSRDVVFIGSYYPNRAELFSKLTSFDLAIWGPGWDKLEPSSTLRKHIMGTHTTPEQWLKIYSAAKIVLATHYRDQEGRFPVYQASPRVFEVLACGAFLISDRQKDVLALFGEGRHFVSFKSPNDLVDKVRYFLDRPTERNLIAKQGQEETLKDHTYVHRVMTLFSYL